MSTVHNRLDAAFARISQAGRIGFFPYLMAGYPDRASCGRLLDVIARSGADGIEIQIPFSDPLADGVTIQRASTRALEQGITVADALDLAANLRREHDLAILLMSYANPLLAYGLDRLASDAAAAGVDGFIVPDVPLGEAEPIQDLLAARGLHFIYLVAPTTDDERLRAVGERATGFVYCVALLGTTGARRDLSTELEPFLSRARRAIQVPLVAGFGIATPAHVSALVGMADGAIVASALIDTIESTDPSQVDLAVERFVKERLAATGGATAAAR